jgi:ParB family chromosome partitioning protein
VRWFVRWKAELSVQERADHIAEWVRLTEEKQSAQLAPKAPVGHRPQGGINAAVRELGIDRTEAQRAVKIAGITPEAKAAADEAGLNTQKARLEIAAKSKARHRPGGA